MKTALHLARIIRNTITGRLQSPRPTQLLRLSLIVLLGGLAAACAGPGVIQEHEVCGQRVVYHPDDLKVCRPGAAACTVRHGTDHSDIYYSTLDTAVLDHEEEHVCGMRHQEPWVPMGNKNCAIVTAPGRTQWKKGDLMCRVDRGAIVKIEDPRAHSQAMARLSPYEQRLLSSDTTVAAGPASGPHVD